MILQKVILEMGSIRGCVVHLSTPTIRNEFILKKSLFSKRLFLTHSFIQKIKSLIVLSLKRCIMLLPKLFPI